MSAFKKLFTDMINADGDASKLNKDLSKQSIKVFVKETSPYFLVSDSFFYVPAYFTQAALDEYKKKFSNVELTDLNEKVILISNWSLELKRVDSRAVFTSYGGVEVRLVVHSFKPQLTEALHPTRWPTNLYRDDEFKTTIQHFRHRSVQQSLASYNGGDGNIVSGKDDWHFKDGTTKVVTLGGAAKKAPAAAAAAPKVKGGASGKRANKAASKSAKKSATKAPAAKTVDKVLKFTPSKKASATNKDKKSVTVGKKATLPTPAGKKSSGNTTDKMSMQTFKQFLKAKSGKKSSTVLGKRSAPKAGKKSATK